MKILHTGDWHLGKLVHGIYMTEDQRHIMDAIVGIIESEKPDVVVITGDVYDRSIPPVEAVDLLDQTLTRIVVGLKTKVIMIAGNHDSPDRLRFGGSVLEKQGLHIRGAYDGKIEPIVLKDRYGEVLFYPVPFVEPSVVKNTLSLSITTHDEAMKAILEPIKANLDTERRHVLVAHGFVAGVDEPETSESERTLSVGGTEIIDAKHFEGFDYVALGHLHRAQRAGADCIRYSGTPLKYSFSEVNHDKSVTLINLDKHGEPTIKLLPLVPKRDMRIIKGELNELLDPAVVSQYPADDYILAVLTDRGELIDPMAKLRAAYPNVLKLERLIFDRETGEERTSAGSAFKAKEPFALFKEFFENTSGEVLDSEKAKEAARIIDKAQADWRRE